MKLLLIQTSSLRFAFIDSLLVSRINPLFYRRSLLRFLNQKVVPFLPVLALLPWVQLVSFSLTMKLLLPSLIVSLLGSLIIPVAGFPPSEKLRTGERCPYADLKARNQVNDVPEQEKRFFDLMNEPIEGDSFHR